MTNKYCIPKCFVKGLRLRSHERWNELKPVWDFRLVWKQVLFRCISKRPNILIDVRRYFISGSVYVIFCHQKWNSVTFKMTDKKSMSEMSFKRTCALSIISPRLRLFILLRLNSVHMKISCRFEISFWSKLPIWNP